MHLFSLCRPLIHLPYLLFVISALLGTETKRRGHDPALPCLHFAGPHTLIPFLMDRWKILPHICPLKQEDIYLEVVNGLSVSRVNTAKENASFCPHAVTITCVILAWLRWYKSQKGPSASERQETCPLTMWAFLDLVTQHWDLSHNRRALSNIVFPDSVKLTDFLFDVTLFPRLWYDASLHD